MSDGDLMRTIEETAFALEICSSGNDRSTFLAARRLRELGRLDRLTFGTDTPGGTGVIPRGMLRNILYLSAVCGLAPGEAIAIATGNTARAHGLDVGRVASRRARRSPRRGAGRGLDRHDAHRDRSRTATCPASPMCWSMAGRGRRPQPPDAAARGRRPLHRRAAGRPKAASACCLRAAAAAGDDHGCTVSVNHSVGSSRPNPWARAFSIDDVAGGGELIAHAEIVDEANGLALARMRPRWRPAMISDSVGSVAGSRPVSPASAHFCRAMPGVTASSARLNIALRSNLSQAAAFDLGGAGPDRADQHAGLEPGSTKKPAPSRWWRRRRCRRRVHAAAALAQGRTSLPRAAPIAAAKSFAAAWRAG